MKKNKTIKMILMQICIFLFALSNVSFKFASTYMASKGLFSIECIMSFVIGIATLGIYALIWQQVLKYYDLNVANAIKTLYLLWGVVFSIFIFKEQYKLSNFLGLILIILGIIVVIRKDSANIIKSEEAKDESNNIREV